MTLKELNEVYYIDKEIQLLTERIENLKTMAEKITQTYSDIPSGSKKADKISKIVAEIEEEKDMMIVKLKRQSLEALKIQRYINSIPDAQIRSIFTCRFINLMSWNEVAAYIGGNNTESSVKKCCYRYIRDNKNKL